MRIPSILKYLSPQNKSSPSTKSQDKLCNDGHKKETFNTELLLMGDTSTIKTKSKKSSKQDQNKKRSRDSESVTQECLQPSRKKTCRDKSKNLKKNTRDIKSTKTLAADSTGKGQTFSGSWLKSVQGWSRKLWLCTETDYVDTDLNSLNSCANSFKRNCWFTVKTKKRISTNPLKKNSHKTSSPLSIYLWQETMGNVLLKTKKEETEKENEKKKRRIRVKAKATIKNPKSMKEPAQRTWKVRLYPTKEERNKLNQMMGTYRYIYNKCVEYHNREQNKDEHGIRKTPDIKELRGEFVNNDPLREKNIEWAKCLPCDSRAEACRDFIAGVKINWKIYNEKIKKMEYELIEKGLNVCQAKKQAVESVSKFEMKYKSKKRKKIQSFFIRERNWNAKNGDFKWLKKIKSKESFDIKYDTRILKDGTGKYFILVLKPLERQSVENRKKIISIDPGERTFLTCYDPEGSVFEFGKNDSDSLIKIGMRADKLQSLHDKKEKNKDGFIRFNSKKRKNLKKKFQKIKYKIQNKIKDCHHKISKYLVESYDNVLLPTFSTSGMVKKEDRRIGSKTVRKLLTWSHYKFRQIIQSKSKRFDAFVIPCEEHYTSKGCGNCGEINNELGDSKEFECPKCKFKSDRDINAARNILLKYIIENSE